MKPILIIGSAVLIWLAFARKARAEHGEGYGQPGFDSTTVVQGYGNPVRVTGASYAEVNGHYYDAVTGEEITRSEAMLRATREGMALP